MTQYITLCKDILDNGVWEYNERTGKRCKVVNTKTLTYDVGAGEFPIDTTRKSFWKAAVAEIIGYLRGYSNAKEFAALGAPTWNANANENEAWLSNPHRKGEGDMGLAYRFREYHVGVPLTLPNGGTKYFEAKVDQYKNIIDQLVNGEDDRGLIMTAWAPHFEPYSCLRSCMHTHTFSLHDGKLHLHSLQRSCDVPLGGNFNMIQCYVLLALTAQITGHKPGVATHTIINAHMYEDQVELMKEQVCRTPYSAPQLVINPDIKTLTDLETWVTMRDFEVKGYEHHPAISYPFTV